MKFLVTYDGARPGELAKVKAQAVRGCIGAVRAPIVSFTEQVRHYCGEVGDGKNAVFCKRLKGFAGEHWILLQSLQTQFTLI